VIVDAHSLAPGTVVDADVVIVGGGFAGLIVARELAESGCRTCVMESGGSAAEQGPQTLAAVESGGGDLAPAVEGWRQLGGSAHLWNTYIGSSRPAARFIPLDPIDFEERDWVPSSGWPLDAAGMDAFYRRARRACGVTGEEGDRGTLPGRPGCFDGHGFTTTVEDFGLASVFAVEQPAAAAGWRRVTVMVHATAVEILMNDAGAAATAVRAASGPGRSFTVAARAIVLAAGAIENARLLLLSNARHRAGIGNQHDLVGRFFMDHHRVNGGHLVPADPHIFDRAAIYDLRPVGGRFAIGKLTPSAELLRRERMLNCSTLFWPRPARRADQAVDSVKQISRDLGRLTVRRETLGHLWRSAAGSGYLFGTGLRLAYHQRKFPPDIGRGRWSLLPANHARFSTFELVHQCEQAPDRENRVTLGAERDELGLPRPKVLSRWSEVDLRSIARLHDLLAEHFADSGLGRVVRESSEAAADLHSSGGMHHHLGTTRMHRDGQRGVVDADCRVHGVGNLFVAGGSVFPTGGYANSSLTMAALAIRLADHLKGVLAPGAQFDANGQAAAVPAG
jgi:choline dehydrogenase-like flavoprotein